jgi:hypothetical protein
MICRTSLFYAGYGEVRLFTVQDYVDLAVSALIVPAGILAVGLVILWVANGFRAAS